MNIIKLTAIDSEGGKQFPVLINLDHVTEAYEINGRTQIFFNRNAESGEQSFTHIKEGIDFILKNVSK